MEKISQAIILAGGSGSRLKEVSQDLPKPLVPIDGISVIERQLQHLSKEGIQEVVLLTGYRGDLIESALSDGSRFGLKLIYQRESTPLGTSGALLSAKHLLADRFFVFYGDTVFNVDLSRIQNFHAEKKTDITLLVHPNSHPFDSDIVLFDEQARVVDFHGYPHPEGIALPNSVNAVLYIVEKQALNDEPIPSKPEDLCKHLFPRLLKKQKNIFAYKSREYIKDMGTTKRYQQVTEDIRSGKVAKGSLRSRVPAIFFDRDGTLTSQLDYVLTPEQLNLFPFAAEALKKSTALGFLNVLVTNQPVIARGDISFKELQTIHNHLEWKLGLEGAFLDEIYFCPHHTDKGFSNEVAELKFNCECRKPNPGMILRAEKELMLDLSSSWMIGDSYRDIECARRAGVRSILVKSSDSEPNGKKVIPPDYEFNNVLEAINFIGASI